MAMSCSARRADLEILESGLGIHLDECPEEREYFSGKGMGRDANGNLYYGHNSDPTNPTVVYCSTDDGNTWSACDSGIPPFLQGHEVVVNHADGKLYAVTEDEAAKTGTLYRTVNPVQ